MFYIQPPPLSVGTDSSEFKGDWNRNVSTGPNTGECCDLTSVPRFFRMSGLAFTVRSNCKLRREEPLSHMVTLTWRPLLCALSSRFLPRVLCSIGPRVKSASYVISLKRRCNDFKQVYIFKTSFFQVGKIFSCFLGSLGINYKNRGEYQSLLNAICFASKLNHSLRNKRFHSRHQTEGYTVF